MRPKALWTLAIIFAAASIAVAQPPLTTIQDNLYKADGTPFEGLLMISWNSFQAGNQANVVSQSLTVKVVGGLFSVQLAPTADANPPSAYTVTYNSDGKVQFQETWVVAATTTALRIADVRVSTTSNPNNSPLQPPNQTPIGESDVTGLVNDLGLRPLKGPGFSSGRAAMINVSGGIDAVIGNPSDCVFVDGTSGPCGGSSPLFSDSEVPGGTIDGNNAVFTLANTPSPAASLTLFRNGIALKATVDYTLTGSTIQFLAGAVPQLGDTLLAWYRLPSASPLIGQQQAFPGSPQVICSAAGSSTSAVNFTSIGSCAIPANILQTGDRVEIHYDLAHTGGSVGFEYQAIWGTATITDRIGVTAETLVAGKAEAGLYSGGAQLRSESWGTVLSFAASVGKATDNIAAGITVNFQAKLAQAATDTVSLANFTVVRYPAQ